MHAAPVRRRDRAGCALLRDGSGEVARPARTCIALKGGPGTANLSDELSEAGRDSDRRGRRGEPALSRRRRRAGRGRSGGDAARGAPAMKVTVQFADGTTEEHVLKNGEHFADALVRAEVPLSADAGRLHRPRPAALLRGQSRQEGRAVEDRARELRHRRRPGDRRHHGGSTSRVGGPVPATGTGQRRAGAGLRRPARIRPKEGGKGDAPLPETKPIVWAPGKTEGAGHRRRQLARFRAVLRRHRRRHARGGRVQRELHRRSRSGGRRDRQGGRRGHQRQPPVLRYARRIARRCSTSRRPARVWSCCTRAPGTASRSGRS